MITGADPHRRLRAAAGPPAVALSLTASAVS